MKLQLEHKLLYQLLQMFLLLCHCRYVVDFLSLSVNIHLSTQFKDIKDILKVLQKLLKYFNGTIISTSFLPLAAVLSGFFSLGLNEGL